METLVQLIFIIALLKYCLKATNVGGFRTMFLYAIGLGIWAFAWYPIVIEQPVTLVEIFLSDRKLVMDGAVLTTLEAVVGILLSIKLLDNYLVPKLKQKFLLSILKLIPSILVLVATLYFELMFFRLRVAENFLMTALIYATLCSGVVFGISAIFKYFVSSENLKLEMKMLFNMLILLVGLLINSSVADYNLSNARTIIDWFPLLAMGVIFTLLFVVGIYTRNWNFRKLFKH